MFLNKNDHDGKTPLYYALTSKEPVPKKILFESVKCEEVYQKELNIASDLINAGATVDVSIKEIKIWKPGFFLKAALNALKQNPTNYRKMNFTRTLAILMTSVLQYISQGRANWKNLLDLLRSIIHYKFGSKEMCTIIFKFFYCLMEKISSIMKIDFKLLNNPCQTRSLLLDTCKFEMYKILRFLIFRGLSLETSRSYYNRSSTVADIRKEANLLDFAIVWHKLRLAVFLIYIRERPRVTSFSDIYYQHPFIKKLILKTCHSPPSLKNLCRLSVNKNWNLSKIEKVCPPEVFKFLIFLL